MNEEWRPFGGAYSVSNLGRVRRERTGPGTRVGRILRATIGSRGYAMVDLYSDGAHRLVNVHRLVAEAFLGAASDGAQVNHKNGDKSDNRLENLEYVTCSENHRHAFRTGLRGPTKQKLSAATVKEIRERLAMGEKQTHLAKEFCVTQSSIWAIGVRRTWRDLV